MKGAIWLPALFISLPVFAFNLGDFGKHFGNTGVTGKGPRSGASGAQKGFSTSGDQEDAKGTSDTSDELIEEDDFLEEEESYQQDEILYQIPSKLMVGGKKLSVSFHDTDIREVMRAFAIKTKLNMVISPKVEGKITTQLYETPAREALKIILRTGNLYFVEREGIIQVLTPDEYRDYALSKLAETKIYTVRHGSLKKAARSIKPYITRGLGKMVINSRTSRLVVTDLSERHTRIAEVLQSLEYDPGQVLITAQILEINYEDQSNVGAFYQMVEQADNSTTLQAQFQSSRAPVSEVNGGLQINFRIDDVDIGSNPKSLLIGLNAVGIEGEINILSSPRLIVQHNKVALINIGSEVPFPTAVSTPNGVVQSSFDFLNAGTRLAIIPKILDEQKIHLNINVESSSATLLKFNEDGSLQAPRKDLTEAKMSAVTKSGQTVMIGGFIRYTQVDDTVGFPVLKNIPGIKYLFSNVVHKIERRELALFLTPKLVNRQGTPIKRHFKRLMRNAEPNKEN